MESPLRDSCGRASTGWFNHRLTYLDKDWYGAISFNSGLYLITKNERVIETREKNEEICLLGFFFSHACTFDMGKVYGVVSSFEVNQKDIEPLMVTKMSSMEESFFFSCKQLWLKALAVSGLSLPTDTYPSLFWIDIPSRPLSLGTFTKFIRTATVTGTFAKLTVCTQEEVPPVRWLWSWE